VNFRLKGPALEVTLEVKNRGIYTIAVYWREPCGHDRRPKREFHVLKLCLAMLFPIVSGMFPKDPCRVLPTLYHWARREFYHAMTGPLLGPVRMPHFKEDTPEFTTVTLVAFERLTNEAGCAFDSTAFTFQPRPFLRSAGQPTELGDLYMMELTDDTDTVNAARQAERASERKTWTIRGMKLMQQSVQQAYDTDGGASRGSFCH
jgi:hypothetical protein